MSGGGWLAGWFRGRAERNDLIVQPREAPLKSGVTELAFATLVKRNTPAAWAGFATRVSVVSEVAAASSDMAARFSLGIMGISREVCRGGNGVYSFDGRFDPLNQDG
jgi:hypothetical protein